MNVGAILDYVAGKLDEQVIAYMQEYAIPPSLMDKILDRLQSHMRQMKAEEYAQEMVEMQISQAVERTEHVEQAGVQQEQKSGVEVDTIEDFKEKVGVKKGEHNADVLSKTGKQGKDNQTV